MLAYHYATAFELARAAGQSERATQLEAPALRFLGLAAERALGLDTAAALASSEHALALAPVGHPDRAVALARFGGAAFHAGRFADAAEALEEAIASFGERGDRLAAARAMGTARGGALPHSGTRAGRTCLQRPSPCSSRCLLAPSSSVRSPTSLAPRPSRERPRPASGMPSSALALAGELGLPRPARTLGYLGFARCDLGDLAGLEDFRDAIALATEAGQGREAGLIYGNFGRRCGRRGRRAGTRGRCVPESPLRRTAASPKTVTYITGSTLDPLFGNGAFDEALDAGRGDRGPRPRTPTSPRR